MTAFRDAAWHDPAAAMMGSQQESCLAHALRASAKCGRRWQVVGFGGGYPAASVGHGATVQRGRRRIA